MMDVVTGKTRPDCGRCGLFLGTYDLTKLDEASIAELGVGRKFQKPTVFEDAYGRGQYPAGALKASRHALDPVLQGDHTRSGAAGIHRILEIDSPQGVVATILRRRRPCTHGQKQWLEIGMLLAPKIPSSSSSMSRLPA